MLERRVASFRAIELIADSAQASAPAPAAVDPRRAIIVFRAQVQDIFYYREVAIPPQVEAQISNLLDRMMRGQSKYTRTHFHNYTVQYCLKLDVETMRELERPAPP